ncbi:MAG: type IX secretion system protein PorQ [Chitinophagaceae bacterium]
MFLLVFFFLFALTLCAQTLGGNIVFNFLKSSNSPQLTALGGINISQQTKDIGLTFNNPALLRPDMHTQSQAVFNSHPGNIRNYNLLTGYHINKWATTFGFGIQYFNYGNTTQTDAAGNILGEFRPTDYAVQAMASRSYLQNWHYGASLKFIHSSYGTYRSSGIAMDIGLTYSDTARFLQLAFVMKNMGFQLRSYNGTSKDELPFDLQFGISKKLEKAPLQLSLNLHHLHQFNIRYNDTAFNNSNGIVDNKNNYFFDKLFRHFVASVQLFVSDKIELSAGYNYLSRKELNIGTGGNGLNGFSLGVGVLIKKIQVRYARTYFQNNQANNQLGIGFAYNSFSSNHKR